MTLEEILALWQEDSKVDRNKIGDELAEMQVQFLSDDEFVELLPYGRVVKLVRFHDTVDWPEDISFKEVLDKHDSLDLRDQLERAVIVVALQFAEQTQGLPVVASRVK